ncbi:hypothetical protein EDC04DRAFT_1717335 [Pisolithus marmoratus]|nr:hypothetical protein EDC04DRAFT_1717335 [Pisolithus marmoratus]
MFSYRVRVPRRFQSNMDIRTPIQRQLSDQICPPNLYLSIEGEPRDGTKVVAKSTPFEWHVEDQPGFQQAIRLFVPETNQNVDLSDNGNPTSTPP